MLCAVNYVQVVGSAVHIFCVCVYLNGFVIPSMCTEAFWVQRWIHRGALGCLNICWTL